MLNPDMVFSLGPNCRNTWNLRDYFQIDRAYPFDWWITPAKSMLALLDREMVFHVAPEDLVMTGPGEPGKSVYNRRLNLLHHHDFDREGEFVRPITPEGLAKVNAKYTALFARFWTDLDKAERPLAILNGIFAGWPWRTPDGGSNPLLNGKPEPQAFFDLVRERLGQKVQILVVEIGEAQRLDLRGGTIISLPDPGTRPALAAGQDWAQPIEVFRDAFAQMGLPRAALAQREDAAGLAISNNTPRVRPRPAHA